jgi:thiamine-phosphate pyrophosphorylase
LLVLSDAARGYDLRLQLGRMPQQAAVIERTFGHDAQKKVKGDGRRLRLATCKPRQARSANLDGVHWPQRRLGLRRKSATRGLVETSSAHNGLAVAKAAQLGLDGILVSTAFSSQSPSATRPLGAIRLARLQRAFPKAKIYALGGITLAKVKSLWRTRIYGVALVSFDVN